MNLPFPLSKVLWLLLAASLPAAADWKAPREALERRLTVDGFRIHYTLEGEHAFPPDLPLEQRRERAAALLDGLAAQLVRAKSFYEGELGLAAPAGGARYREVRAVDVHILALQGKTGSTGDEPIVYRYRHHEGAVPALTMTLSNRWAPPNLTPEHEVFHAYQYGYTFFKNPWFLEGMARSMERAFKDGEARAEPLPRSSAELRRVTARSYGAESLWNRLMARCDPACGSRAAPARFCGGGLVRATLEQYQALDKEAARARGIAPGDWPEAEQRSERNQPYLLLGLRRAVESHCRLRGNPELEAFHGLLQAAVPRP